MRAVTSWLSRIWRADALSAFGLAALLLLIFLGIFGPWLPLGDPTQIAAGPRLGAPTLQHPFGTDELGRSFLPRVVQGIRATFLLSAVAVLISAVIGTLLGMAAGYFGRAVDIVVARGADILFAFPAILVGLLVAAVLGPGQVSAIAVIGAIWAGV